MANPISFGDAAIIARESYYAAVGFESRSAASEAAAIFGGSAAAVGTGIVIPVLHFTHDRADTFMSGRNFTFDDQVIPRVESSTPSMAGSKRRSRSRKRSGRAKKKLRFTKSKRSNARIGGFLGIEHKFSDLNYNQALVTSLTGAEASPTAEGCLNAIARGDGESERDGRRVRMTSIQIDGLINFEAQTQASPEGGHYVRVLLVIDKQTNGAQMNSEDLFRNPGDANLEINAHYSMQNVARYKVLKDILVWSHARNAVWNGSNTLTASSQVPFHMKLPLNQTVHFGSGSTAQIANIRDYSVHILAFGSVGMSGKIQYVSRLRFYG